MDLFHFSSMPRPSVASLVAAIAPPAPRTAEQGRRNKLAKQLEWQEARSTMPIAIPLSPSNKQMQVLQQQQLEAWRGSEGPPAMDADAFHLTASVTFTAELLEGADDGGSGGGQPATMRFEVPGGTMVHEMVHVLQRATFRIRRETRYDSTRAHQQRELPFGP